MLATCKYCGKVHNKKEKCKAIKGYYRAKNSRYNKDGEYLRLIKSKQWQRLSKEIKMLDGQTCLICRDCGLISPTYLEVHHIEKIRKNYSNVFEKSNLISLCVFHHKQCDNNEVSEEEQKRLIKKYRIKSNDITML